MKDNPASRKGAKLRISEIYSSLQGEGLLTGTPSSFVRTSGCNLRCWFCDTRFASWAPEGSYQTVDAVCRSASLLGNKHVVVTGGEPMIFNALVELCASLGENHHITIETAGTVYHPLQCDLMSISPKLSRSGPEQHQTQPPSPSWQRRHDERRERLDVVQQLMDEHPYQLKFVVDTPHDAEEVLAYLDRLKRCDRDRVLVMPQGIQESELDAQAEWLIPWCSQHKSRFCPRSHIHWYGNKRGT